MKAKVKVTTVIILALVITGYIIRLYFSSVNSLDYKIFKAEAEGYYFHKLLGIIPSSYQHRYTRTILDSFDDKELINIIDVVASSHPNFIVFINGSDARFLKAYPFELVGVKKSTIEQTEWSRHVSLLININVFNEYVKAKQIRKKKEIIERYCSFIPTPPNDSTYKILREASDADSLIAKHPLNNEFLEKAKTGLKLIEPKDINFLKSADTVYCWFYNIGIVKFVFRFNDDNVLEAVESEIVGFLGNEFPTM